MSVQFAPTSQAQSAKADFLLALKNQTKDVWFKVL
jgi:hypothetical protein